MDNAKAFAVIALLTVTLTVTGFGFLILADMIVNKLWKD